MDSSGQYLMKVLHTQGVRIPISSSLGIGSAGDSFVQRFGPSSYTRAHRSPTGEGHASCQHSHRLLLSLHLRQYRLSLGEPEGHLHGPVQVDGGIQMGTGLLLLACPSIQRAKATVAVGLEWAHAQFFGQGEGCTVVGFGLLDLRRIAPRRNVADEVESIRL